MTDKHTPGPWVWTDKVLQGYAKYAGPHDRGGFIDANGEMVCWFGDGEQYYPTDGEPPNAADRALIAAAPDLLDACETAMRIIRAAGLDDRIGAHEIQAAIAKATRHVPD